MAHKVPTETIVRQFTTLPPEQRVSLPVVCALYDAGKTTIWRRVKSGLIPAPIKEGHSTRWTVGDLRAALAR